MRSIISMDNIQIELTDACVHACSNCTRFCGHRDPYFITFDQFKQAIDSMKGYPKMTGFMGGEPLLHPEFEKFCEYARSQIPKHQLGLWTGFPKGKEHYRETICQTFDHIFINDHTRPDIYHAPILVASEEIIRDRNELFFRIDQCWLQNAWSASINPNGAFFCEIAASMSLLFDGPKGWPVEPGWWWRTPKDFREQIEEYCPKCGVCLPLPRRSSTDGRDDISLGNLTRLALRSKKIAKKQYVVSDLKMATNPEPMAAYKDIDYRQAIAARYGIYLTINDYGFLTPHLSKENRIPRPKVYDTIVERYRDLEGRV